MAKTYVLVVEDDPPVRDALVEALELDGYEVEAVDGGRQALQALTERCPDAIVLDLMMPTMNGWEFRRLQRQIHRDVPILVVSATLNPDLDDLRPDAFLTKPFDLDHFLVVLRRLLHRTGGAIAS